MKRQILSRIALVFACMVLLVGTFAVPTLAVLQTRVSLPPDNSYVFGDVFTAAIPGNEDIFRHDVHHTDITIYHQPNINEWQSVGTNAIRSAGLVFTVDAPVGEYTWVHMQARLHRIGNPTFFVYGAVINVNNPHLVYQNTSQPVNSAYVSSSWNGSVVDFGLWYVPAGTYRFVVTVYNDFGNVSNCLELAFSTIAPTVGSSEAVGFVMETSSGYSSPNGAIYPTIFLEIIPQYQYVYQTFTWETTAPLLRAYLLGRSFDRSTIPGTSTIVDISGGYQVLITGLTLDGKPDLRNILGYAGSENAWNTPSTQFKPWGGLVGAEWHQTNGISLPAGKYAIVGMFYTSYIPGIYHYQQTSSSDYGFYTEGAIYGRSANKSLPLSDHYSGGEFGYGLGWEYDVNWFCAEDNPSYGYHDDLCFWLDWDSALIEIPIPTLTGTNTSTGGPSGTGSTNTTGTGGVTLPDFPDITGSNIWPLVIAVCVIGLVIVVVLIRKK